jgi:hypothetical protein
MLSLQISLSLIMEKLGEMPFTFLEVVTQFFAPFS